MKNPSLHAQKQRLDHLFARVKEVADAASDPELQSHWARYLCILVAGFLETSVHAIYASYAREQSSPSVAKFVAEKLRRERNMNMETILRIARSFSVQWAEELRAETSGERQDAVNAILANRHQIAHGRSVGITYSQIRTYYERALEVLDMAERKCAGR
jgi:hypothetical protein